MTMETYIGVKSLEAKPMSLGEYNKHRGWAIPVDEDPQRPGYLVRYADGYESWSPKEGFEKAYHEAEGMTFGLALEVLKRGGKIMRNGWNGKGMWLVFVKPYSDAVHSGNTPCFSYRAFELPEGANGEPKKSPTLLPYIAMKTVGDELVPWLASQTDVLAEDWLILE